MGKEAWIYASSLRWMLQIDSNKDRCKLSSLASTGERKQGAVRRTYSTFGRENTFRSRHRASWECKRESRSAITSMEPSLDESTLFMDYSPPIGDPRRQASTGSTHLKLGYWARIDSAVAGLTPIISVFRWLSSSPRASAAPSSL